MKKALIVGINYPGTSHALNGCVNDAIAIDSILKKHFSFLTQDIKILLDNKATTANMLAGLEWLVADAAPGDTLFFHYSGHGSQMLDNADADHEPDGLDEILCPVDLDWDTKVIRDDDLKRIFDKLPAGVNLTVCLDCCNSGGALDQLNQYQPDVDTALEGEGGRFLPPPSLLLTEKEIGFKPKAIQHKDVDQTGLLLTGCRSYQTSADAYINGKYQGAFTYALTKVLADYNYEVNYVTLIEEINRFMVEAGFTQRPELNGSQSLFLSNFLGDREYENADLSEVTTVQPHVDPMEPENKENNIFLIIVGILALSGIAAYFLK